MYIDTCFYRKNYLFLMTLFFIRLVVFMNCCLWETTEKLFIVRYALELKFANYS